ncbi:hexosaminidase [Haloactinopolyspora alba]|uniref:beta-N-acetylhexosaminidase n=1 Tax=Haloactinopolyspora alba TaxID=648780 RepID=A0A2P8D3V0_9ACTN|nr:beta-N-acetylhexosaminidase [Haloactinopolyspora alba]PSK91886.1 hexosaminidase [Haloactinopolyspora alba]
MPVPHADIHVLPRPTELTTLPGRFTLDAGTSVRVGPGTEPAASLLRELFTPAIGPALPPSADGAVALVLDTDRADLGTEGYHLTVGPDEVLLRAAAPAGLLHAVQTLRQLLPAEAFDEQPTRASAWEVPCVRITDVPRLPWRGAMIDVARHFQPISALRRFVDLLALHKMNVLHLHLTDDQGWRMPVAAYPKLVEIGAHRPETTGDGVPHGGSYTRRELTDLVAYAARRGITIVPEIELPGHSRAALAAYPELGNHPDRVLGVWTRWGVSEQILGVHDLTQDFCRTVLDEVMDTFPGRYIHLGGDECPLTEWEQSPDAAARMREHGLTGPRELYRWFMAEVGNHVLRAGRRPVAWAEGDDLTLPSPFTVLPWRDEAHGRAAADRGHDVVMAPHLATYLDYAETSDPGELPSPDGSVTELHTVQAYAPVPDSWEPDAAARVLGTQGQLWSEYLPTPEHVEYRAFPRLCALAESAWSGPGDWSDFTRRLEHHRLRLDVLGVPRTQPSS